MFSITVAKTKIQKIRQNLSTVERWNLLTVETRKLFYLAGGRMNWYNHAEKLSGKFLVKQTNVYDSAIPVLHFSSVQSLSQVWLFATPWIAACQASLSITNSQSSPKLMRIKSVMPSSHLILRRPLLLLPPIPPSIRVFSTESTLHMKWPKYWSFSLRISPSNEYPGLVSFRMDWLDLLAEIYINFTEKSKLQESIFKRHHSSKVAK